MITSIKTKFKDILARFFSGEGMSYRDVFSLLLPVVVDQFFLIGFNFINTAMISSSGAAAISAVNIVGSLNALLVQLFTSIALGGTVLIAQYYGQKNYKMIGKMVNGGVYATVLVATTAAILFMLLHSPILALLFGAA
ncbi:MATE family efflux transporter [Loigolactobacillus coryniformis]|uniref:MATE family efflux transporter n=1 Tax=Loigolactobacillus coryniformis TaxID=1610 RepID=UPI0002FA1EB2|nr:MATE family efflux transporter [Loigolactobacillus coryniformis]